MKSLVAAVLLLSAALGCGEGEQVQPETADSLRESAEQGSLLAPYSLAMMYLDGRGVAQDDAEAVRWYRLAAVHLRRKVLMAGEGEKGIKG